ncbi:MAG: hypothetical protein J6P88_04025 [Clostridia bacterium]|nr:hypothetical protein [Clostridia bacterium]MBP5428645.1 hypothetical protein [Clostridia bacterium]
MKLKLSSRSPEPVPESRPHPSARDGEEAKPLLLIDLLRRWAEEIRRAIDTEVKIEDVLPRETAIEVPEERFAYLLTLIYRLLSHSPKLGDPSVKALPRGDSIAVVLAAEKTGSEPMRLSEREALGVSDHYLRLIARDLAACGANWYFDETRDRFSVVVSLAGSKADVSRLLAPIPDGIARAVRAALRKADELLRRSR